MLLVVVLFLAASLVFAFEAFISPVKSVPPSPPFPACAEVQSMLSGASPLSASVAKACASSKLAWSEQIAMLETSTHEYDSYLGTATGLAVVSLLCFLALSKFSLPKGPRLRVPRVIRDVALLGAASGLVIFSAFVCEGLSPSDTYFFEIHHPGIMSNFGLYGFACFAFACICSAVYLFDKGVVIAFLDAFLFLACPVLVVYELHLLFAPTGGFWAMWEQAAQFLSRIPLYGVTNLGYVVTNWFLLVVSLGFFTLGLAHVAVSKWMKP